jgi:hypothetical protein
MLEGRIQAAIDPYVAFRQEGQHGVESIRKDLGGSEKEVGVRQLSEALVGFHHAHVS